jgi:tRNA 5-methylaminomethyl-2-thiouridine biosynthesis bifunctional protein
MARLSAPRARAATFTVAGEVRRGLEAAGFAVEKKPGCGAQRERLEAARTGPEAAGARTIFPYAARHPKRVAVLGAGIAGAACARALMRRGVEVVVLEAAREPGAGASGNPAGLVTPRFDRGGGALAELYLAAYLDAVAAYEALDVFMARGVERRPLDEREAAAFADLTADPPLPDDWLVAADGGGLWHPRAGLVDPQAAVAAMLVDAQVIYESPVRTLEAVGDSWLLRAPDGRALMQADAVVLACGPALTQFDAASFLPITLSRGQIEWGKGLSPARALTQGSYVAPFEGGVLFGATFDNEPDPWAPAQADDASRQRNLAALAKLAPEIAASVGALQSRASYRATTPDRAPVAGLLPDAPAWLAQYAAIGEGRDVETDAPAPAHAGVYVIGGLGARGLTLAPLLGERLAAEICGDVMPLQRYPNASSRRRSYLEWVEEQIEAYKESVSRTELLGVADEVVADLRVNSRGQYQLTELLLAEAVDRRIFRMLKLPTYRAWAADHPAPVAQPLPPAAVEERPVCLPEAASF